MTQPSLPRLFGWPPCGASWTLSSLALVWALSGCAELPLLHEDSTASTDTVQNTLAQDRAKSQREIEPISGELTLDEALARALKYNLERRVRQMEQDIASGQYEASLQDMLPRLQAQVERQTRSNDRGTASGSTSADRNHTTADIDLSWNLLDFGLGYYNAKQNQQRLHIASEKRRKAVHTLMQDVRSAFWRAASAQTLRDQVRHTIAEAEKTLEQARQLETERVRSPLESVKYQRQLLENIRTLEAIDQELAPAEVELATLINAPLHSALTLRVSWPDQSRLSLDASTGQLESIALQRNADLRETLHQSQIARLETYKVLARLFPNLNLSVASRYDTDSYLLHRDWSDANLRLSFNLFNLLSAPTQMKLADAGVDLADQRRMVMQMAVITQVNLAYMTWRNAQKQLQRAEQIWQADHRLAQLSSAREQALMGGRMDTVSAQAAALLSQFRRFQSVAQIQVAESRLRATLGLDPDLERIDALSLPQVVHQIQTAPDLQDLPRLSAPAPTPPTVSPTRS